MRLGTVRIGNPAAALVATLVAGSLLVAFPAQTAPAVAYRVDGARSSAGFTMKATLHTVEGKAGAVSGEFTLPSPPGPDGFAVTGRIAIASKTLDTGNGSRDKRMRTEILSVERFPEIVFVPSAVVGKFESFLPGSTAKVDLKGDLTIHGVTRPATIALTATFNEGGLVADGTTSISFLDFGVPDPSNFFLRVNPNLTVTFHLEARVRE